GGTMVYESDDFYDLCDELGILVWQDFMFANMDYPEDDVAFVAGVTDEAQQQLARLQARPSLAVLCGNSEGEQQAAMFGASRDRYLAQLFGPVAAEPMRLRYGDHERYLALSRVVTGEIMAGVFGEWRTRRSTCGGGLVWFLRDLWPSAGWGVVDAGGAPKAAWYYLRRALQPVAAHISDEGGNGLTVHLGNERPTPLAGALELTLFTSGEVKVASARRDVTLAPRETVEVGAATLFENFIDLSYAYRFRPPSHDLVVATLRGAA